MNHKAEIYHTAQIKCLGWMDWERFALICTVWRKHLHLHVTRHINMVTKVLTWYNTTKYSMLYTTQPTLNLMNSYICSLQILFITQTYNVWLIKSKHSGIKLELTYSAPTEKDVCIKCAWTCAFIESIPIAYVLTLMRIVYSWRRTMYYKLRSQY
jgi:hypothetical protein